MGLGVRGKERGRDEELWIRVRRQERGRDEELWIRGEMGRRKDELCGRRGEG